MLLKRLSKKITLLFLGDIFLMLFAQYLNDLLFLKFTPRPIPASSDMLFITAIFCSIFYIFDLHDPNTNYKTLRFFTRFLITIIISSGITAIGFYLKFSLEYGRLIFFSNVIAIGFLTYLWRLFLNRYFRKLTPDKKIISVGAGRAGLTMYQTLKGRKYYNVIGFLDDDEKKIGKVMGSPQVIGNTNLMNNIVRNRETDILILAITHQKKPEIFKIMLEAKMKGIDVYDMPTFFEIVNGEVPVEHIKDSWFVYTEMSGVKIGIYNRHFKRIIDIFLSFSIIIISLPITFLTALLIELDSSGPIFYFQERLGLNNRIFKIIKFRSMEKNAETNGAVWAQENDSRVTRVGNIIRKLRIDEIPQCWNVLKGDMSFIGPRPEREEFIEKLNKKIPYYSLRHYVRPGITGWAQVNYPYGASEEDALRKLQFDLYYIKNLSPLLDLHIFLKTIKVVLMSKGSR
ncbi:MAG: sugar transferase [Candidatus Firestonebacteria bacterium]|nr:sugar transferase [Candidatus Firestonebacteria bacterium]